MVTFNTDTKTLGHDSGLNKAPHPTASAADKAGGSIEFFADGSSVHKKPSGGPQTIDTRARELAEIKASASGPSAEPIQLRHRNGGGASVAQAEVNPKRYLLSIHGRETSLQAAITAGWVVRGTDGNYYDARVGGGSTPGKSQGAEAPRATDENDIPEEHENAEDSEDDPEATLPEGFELDDAQKEVMARLHALADENPGAIDYAFTQAANSGDLSADGFVKTITERVGGEREEVESLIEAATATYVAATDAAVAKISNVEPSLVYDWLREKQPAMATQVIMGAQAGNFQAVGEATNAYLSSLDSIDPEAALNADLGPHAKAERVNGKVAVRINGRLVSWREAMRYRAKT